MFTSPHRSLLVLLLCVYVTFLRAVFTRKPHTAIDSTRALGLYIWSTLLLLSTFRGGDGQVSAATVVVCC